jgi:hypothetical protein
MHQRYNAEIVAGALLPSESRIIARLVLDNVPDEEIYRLLTVENILQKRSPATAVRKYRLIEKRLQLIDKELLLSIAEGTRQVCVQALLVAAIKHSKLIGDFLLRVIKEKWRIFETELKPSDWDNFLRDCEQIDQTVSKWKPTTRDKLGQVVRKCLVEAGYLESISRPVITPVLLLPEIKNNLIKHKENYVLDCMSFSL